MNELGNSKWLESKRVFAEITMHPDHPQPLINLLDPENGSQWDQYSAITALLTYFEAVAGAIKHDAISETI